MRIFHALQVVGDRRVLNERNIVLLTLFVAAAGCSIWRDSASDPMDLPTTRMSPDSVALEITFVRIPVGAPELNDQVWQSVDEHVLAANKRLHLNKNGFRTGIVGARLPEAMRQLLDRQGEASTLDHAVTSSLDMLAQNRRVHARAGKRTEIVTGDTRSSLVVLYRDPDEERVGGKSFQDAQCMLAIRPFPDGDGSVRLNVTPEVHHGPIHNQWIPEQGALRQMAGRKREVFQHLAAELTLNPGQTLIVSCTPERTGVGHSFFVESGQGDPQQKLLLIRLAQSQRDELFDD